MRVLTGIAQRGKRFFAVALPPRVIERLGGYAEIPDLRLGQYGHLHAPGAESGQNFGVTRPGSGYFGGASLLRGGAEGFLLFGVQFLPERRRHAQTNGVIRTVPDRQITLYAVDFRGADGIQRILLTQYGAVAQGRKGFIRGDGSAFGYQEL